MLREHHRGQAIPELAVTIALLVSAMLFIFVVARYGVIGERAATALRIAGTLTQNQNPYRFASLDTTYQAADNAYNAGSDQKNCTRPDSGILYGEGLLNGAASANFWNPSSIPSAPTCAFSMTLFRNAAVRTQGDLLVEQFDYSISAEAGGWTSTLANSAGTLFGGAKQSIVESARFYQPPSLETLIQCYSNLGPAVSASLNPTKDVSDAEASNPLSQGEATAIRTRILLSPTSCTGLTLAAGPYQPPPDPLRFPNDAAAQDKLPGKGGGSTHGKFSRVNAYQSPSTPAPGLNPVGGKPGGSSGSSSSSKTKGAGSKGSSGSSSSSPSGNKGNDSSSTGGSGGSGSGIIRL